MIRSDSSDGKIAELKRELRNTEQSMRTYAGSKDQETMRKLQKIYQEKKDEWKTLTNSEYVHTPLVGSSKGYNPRMMPKPKPQSGTQSHDNVATESAAASSL